MDVAAARVLIAEDSLSLTQAIIAYLLMVEINSASHVTLDDAGIRREFNMARWSLTAICNAQASAVNSIPVSVPFSSSWFEASIRKRRHNESITVCCPRRHNGTVSRITNSTESELQA